MDGSVYTGAEDASFLVLAAGKEKKIISKTEFPSPVYATAIAANGALYVQTHTHLYAIRDSGSK